MSSRDEAVKVGTEVMLGADPGDWPGDLMDAFDAAHEMGFIVWADEVEDYRQRWLETIKELKRVAS